MIAAQINEVRARRVSATGATRRDPAVTAAPAPFRPHQTKERRLKTL